MPDKKLTDSEIVKALKEILEIMLVMGDLQKSSTISKAIDQINRQQAENKKLQKFKAYFDFYYGSNIEILGIDENGDTTSFDEFYNCAIANAESIEHHIAHIIKTAKAKAVAEFVERLKEYVFRADSHEDGFEHDAVDIDDVYNILKELVGEDK